MLKSYPEKLLYFANRSQEREEPGFVTLTRLHIKYLEVKARYEVLSVSEGGSLLLN